jgi:hypothetical protein
MKWAVAQAKALLPIPILPMIVTNLLSLFISFPSFKEELLDRILTKTFYYSSVLPSIKILGGWFFSIVTGSSNLLGPSLKSPKSGHFASS